LAGAIAEVIGEETAARYRNGPWGLGHDDVAAHGPAGWSRTAWSVLRPPQPGDRGCL